ncbi:MAG: hypothetical protein ABIH01_05380 [Candidatus Omnitrophota bacterium]
MRLVAMSLILSCILFMAVPAFAAWELKSSGLATEAQNYIAKTELKGKKTTFSVDDERVVWYGKFTNPNAPLGRFGLPRNFYANWFSPDGKVYASKRFTSSLGNKTAAHTAIYIKNTKAAQMRGSWKVTIIDWDKKQVVDEQRFEIR